MQEPEIKHCFCMSHIQTPALGYALGHEPRALRITTNIALLSSREKHVYEKATQKLINQALAMKIAQMSHPTLSVVDRTNAR